MARKMLRNVVKRGVHAARNGLSPPPTPAGGPVARPEMSTADRLGSRQGSGRAPAGEGRELLRPWGDERVRSLSHRGAVSFKTHFHRYWTGVRWEKVDFELFSRHDADGRRGSP